MNPELPRDRVSISSKGAFKAEEKDIAIDGFNQVIEMLRVADPSFRESLLKRLAQRDPQLARELRQDLGL